MYPISYFAFNLLISYEIGIETQIHFSPTIIFNVKKINENFLQTALQRSQTEKFI